MIFEKVRDIIVETVSCEAQEVKMETSLKDDLGLDSLDAVELNMALEEALSITIPDEALEKMKLVSDLVEFIENNNQ